MLESLEDRCLLSFLQTNLVSDVAGLARITDANLVNPWGIAINANTGNFWLADNGSGVSTIYDGSGKSALTDVAVVDPYNPPSSSTTTNFVVTVPTPPGGTPPSAPTGTVFNGGTGFVVKQGANSGPSQFIFVTEDGTISGWSPNVNNTNAILAVDKSASGAVYKGVALGNNASGTFLFAANFHAGAIDVFDKNFAAATLSGSFTDPNLPAGFAPFNIQNLNGNLFVTYAKQDATKENDVAGPGNGFVDIFDTNGNFVKRLTSQGTLNSPWGLALSPTDFGEFGNSLLVGNFGDGHISAFDPNTGAFRGQLSGPNGQPISIDHLWGLNFGAGAAAANPNALYFSAGIDDEMHGLFGTLQATGSILVTGAGGNGGPQVNVFNANTGSLNFSFFPFSPSFAGGVRVAVGDVNGDGVADVIAAAGPGGGPNIGVFNGATGQRISGPLSNFFAFDPAFTNGIFVAAGDINHDGFADILVGADAGGGPNITAFSGKDGGRLFSIFAFDPLFVGGVRVGAADVNGDGFADVLVGAGAGGGPNIEVFDGKTLVQNKTASPLVNFFAFDPAFVGGVFVGGNDVNGDGKADVVVGPGSGGGPNVRVYDGKTITGASLTPNLLQNFFAYDPAFINGVRVGLIDLHGDGHAAIITGPGPGGGPQTRVFDLASGKPIDDFFAYNPLFTGGVFVGGGR